MKCPACGANIGVRDEFCAWCGKPNERAGRHLQILKRYRTATDVTRSELERQTLHRVPVFIRLLVIALLLGGFAVVIILSSTAWDREEGRIRRNADLHAAEYAATLDNCMAEGDAVEFCRFCNAHRIEVYRSGHKDSPYRKYRRYSELADNYVRIMSAAMQLYPYRTDSYRSEADIIQSIAENTNSFYGTLERAEKDDDPPLSEEMLRAAADLEDQLRALLITYLGVDPSDADRLRELTDAQRRLLLETAWDARKGDA